MVLGRQRIISMIYTLPSPVPRYHTGTTRSPIGRMRSRPSVIRPYDANNPIANARFPPFGTKGASARLANCSRRLDGLLLLALVPTPDAHVSILHSNGPPTPIDLTYDTSANARPRWFVNITVYMKLRMHHGHVRRQKAHMHDRRFASARSERSARSVQSRH